MPRAKLEPKLLSCLSCSEPACCIRRRRITPYIQLGAAESKQIGSTSGASPFWGHYPDSYCEENDKCFDDGCQGAWPLSQCTTHQSREKNEGVFDLKCTLEPGWGGCDCYQSHLHAQCSTVVGICIVHTLNENPLVQICATQLAGGWHSNPQDCESFCW
jgi:hypothetical protein